jgi:hypothetical protein
MHTRRQVGVAVLGLAALTLWLAAAGGARAAFVAYNNFGPGNGGLDYNVNGGIFLGSTRKGTNEADGVQFTPSQTGTLSQITVALEYISGANAATVSLRADAGGLPGAVLESFNLTDLPPLPTPMKPLSP